jgi:hypothetical protein
VIAGEGVAKGVQALTSFLDGMTAALRESTVLYDTKTSFLKQPKWDGFKVMIILSDPGLLSGPCRMCHTHQLFLTMKLWAFSHIATILIGSVVNFYGVFFQHVLLLLAGGTPMHT